MPMRDGRGWRPWVWMLCLACSGAWAQGDAPPDMVNDQSQPAPLLQGRAPGSDAAPVATPSDTDAQAAPRIGLVTMAPGLEYWTRFGHNAILVDDGQRRTLYNYGYFDFAQPGFLVNFLRGRMLYQLVALPMDQDLRGYARDGRGVRLQWLGIEPGRARELADFLQWNAQPENAEYRYDYFVDNCSTRVRDALDRALDGALKRQLSGRSHGFTFRDEARRLSASPLWLYLGIHLGLGPFTDRPLSLWEESYVPMRLHDALNDVRSPSGQALVVDEVELVPHTLEPDRTTPPDWRWRFGLTGLAIAIALGLGLRPTASTTSRRIAAAATAALWTLCGFVGLGLLALWAFTDHAAAWGNENALLFNPFCLALLPAARRLARGGPIGRTTVRIAVAIAACAGVAMFLKFLPFRIQSNGDWVALLLPVHAALAWRLSSTFDAARAPA